MLDTTSVMVKVCLPYTTSFALAGRSHKSASKTVETQSG